MMLSRSTIIVGSAALAAIGLIIGAGLAEVAYRGWLYRLPFFGVYDKSLWEFDQRFGYVYPPGRTVHLTLLNGSRVVAAAKVPEWKPDLAVIAFITDDLNRARFWRTVIEADGDERVLTTVDPTPHPAPDRAADTFILDRNATHDWRNRMWKSGERDQVVEEIEDHYWRAHGNTEAHRPSLLTLSHVYLYDRIRYRDPFHSWRKRSTASQNPRIGYDDYRVDDRLTEDLRLLAESHVPYVIVHLPYFPELEKGREYLLQPQQTSLLQSLERLTGRRVIGLKDVMPLPLAGLERMNISAGRAKSRASSSASSISGASGQASSLARKRRKYSPTVLCASPSANAISCWLRPASNASRRSASALQFVASAGSTNASSREITGTGNAASRSESLASADTVPR
jgi:hypothetical protein